MTGSDKIDEVLELFQNTGPEFGKGLSNHGPMAGEAMIRMGREDTVIDWSNQYKKRLSEHPKTRDPINANSYKEALGDGRRIGDWIEFFRCQLKERPWQDVLDNWSSILAPGIMAGGTHGIIRTAHSVKTLAAGENELRLNELAEGLGYWAARFQRLPTAPEAEGSNNSILDVLKNLEHIPREESLKAGLIADAAKLLHNSPSFDQVINKLPGESDSSKQLSLITEAFTRVYLANASDRTFAIGFIHSVTAPSAVRLMMPFLTKDSLQTCIRYVWQASSGLYTLYGNAPPAEETASASSTKTELIEDAVACADEHAIKFADACLREFEVNSNPVYLAAACDSNNKLAKDAAGRRVC